MKDGEKEVKGKHYSMPNTMPTHTVSPRTNNEQGHLLLIIIIIIIILMTKKPGRLLVSNYVQNKVM